MFNKYSNLLTMFLVVLIVAILGIGGYFAYDTFHSKSVNANAGLALEEFEKATTSVKKDKTNSSTTANTTAENTVSSGGSLDDIINNMNTNTVEEPEEPVEQEPEKQEPPKVMMEGYEVLGRIEIPKTKVDYPILDKLTKRSLEIATSVAYGPGLNEPGNTIIYGHNYRNGLFFSNNKKLANGDKVYITDKYGNRVEYKIYNIYQTTPSDASYMQRPTDGRREISLQTCTDDSSGRIIIWATAD